MVLQLTKRDGRQVPFEGKKIYDAVYKACKAVFYTNTECERIATKIQEEVEKYYIVDKQSKVIPTVEDVQERVMNELIKEGMPEVTKAYIEYRTQRTMQREMKSDLNKALQELTFASAKESNLKRDNGNVNGDTAMGMMLQFGSTTSREFTDKFLLSSETKEAVDNMDIYIHDKDFYPMGTLTCCQIPLDKLFKEGFNPGHGMIRPPQTIQSYASLTAIAIQSNQNEMHGGQAIPLFDFYLAPGVVKSFRKNFLEILNLYLDTINITQQTMTAPASMITNADERGSRRNDMCTNADSNCDYKNSGSLSDVSDIDADLKQAIQHLTELPLSSWKQENATKTIQTISKMLEIAGVKTGFIPSIWAKSLQKTDRDTYQAMESLVHNLNTLHSRAGSQVPFSSINFGMDTSEEGRMVSRNLLLAQEAGLGQGETPIFPILIFQVKEGVNYNEGDPNYDLFKLSFRVSAKRLFPNYVFVDAPFNLQYYDPEDPETIIATMGCVDGKHSITYKIGDNIYHEPFEDAWFRLTRYFVIQTAGMTDFMDCENMSIYDSNSHDFVTCHRILRNPDMGNWMKVTFETGHVLMATADHPLPLQRGRVFVQDVTVGDVGYVLYDEKVVESRIVDIEFVGSRGRYSYDVTTASDRFDVSNILSHNCRTRVIGNVNGKQTPVGRGNLSFTTINLPRLGIKHGTLYRQTENRVNDWDKEGFFRDLDRLLDISAQQLLERYAYQKQKRIANFPFLMGQKVWSYKGEKRPEEKLDDIIDSGTLSVGFIGLAECLKALTGQHHGESPEVQQLGLDIIGHMREKMDEMTKKTHLNFSVLATPSEGLSGKFTKADRKRYGVIEGVTDREYYTNSFHVPVYYPIDFVSKIRLESPYHALTNAGHITYVEMDGNPEENLEAFETIIRCMKESGIGYGSINHPIDRDPVCGYTGVIEGDTCPGCGRPLTNKKIKQGCLALESLAQEE